MEPASGDIFHSGLRYTKKYNLLVSMNYAGVYKPGNKAAYAFFSCSHGCRLWDLTDVLVDCLDKKKLNKKKQCKSGETYF